MKATTQGKVCLACGKRPAAELGFCGECQKRVYLDSFTAEAKDPRTKKSWPIADLVSFPNKAASI